MSIKSLKLFYLTFYVTLFVTIIYNINKIDLMLLKNLIFSSFISATTILIVNIIKEKFLKEE